MNVSTGNIVEESRILDNNKTIEVILSRNLVYS